MGVGPMQPVDLRNSQPWPIPAGNSNPTNYAQSDSTFGRVQLQRFDVDLTTAIGGGILAGGQGKREELKGTGLVAIRFFTTATLAAATGLIEVQFNGEGGWVPFEKGSSFNPVPFDFVKLRAEAQAGISVAFIYWTDTKDAPLER